MQLEVSSNSKHALKVLKARLSYYESIIKDESAIIDYCDLLNLNINIYKEQVIEEIIQLNNSIKKYN